MKVKSKSVFRRRSIFFYLRQDLDALISMSKQFAIENQGEYFRCVYVKDGQERVSWVSELSLSTRFNLKGARHTLANLGQGLDPELQGAKVRNYLVLVFEEYLCMKSDKAFFLYHRIRQNWVVLSISLLLTLGLIYTL